MRYYKVIDTLGNNVKNSWDLGKVLNYTEDIQKIHRSFWDDTFIDEAILLEVDLEYGSVETDYHLCQTGIHIVSESFKDLFTDDEATFYPVRFSNFNPKMKYYALRVNNFLDCVDENKTKIKYWTPEEISLSPLYRENTYRLFDTVFFDKSKINGERIFRLLKSPREIYVNEDVKYSIEKLSLKGMLFSEVK